MKKLLLVILALIFFVSCSSAPKQFYYPSALQQHMQAAIHWTPMAKKFSMQVAEFLKSKQSPSLAKYSQKGDFGHSLGPNSSQIMFSDYYGVYLDKRDQSAFGKAFRKMLLTELWERDIEVVDRPEHAYTISWGCQKIYYENYRSDIFPGIPMFVGASVGYALFGGDINPKKPNWEVMITLNLQAEENLLLRDTEIKYVSSEDISKYSNITDPLIKEHDNKPVLSNYVVVSK